MTKNEILDYIMETPGNTNRQILSYLLDEISGEGGNILDIVTTLSSGGDYHAISGIAVEGTKNITENGAYDISTYKNVEVDIPFGTTSFTIQVNSSEANTLKYIGMSQGNYGEYSIPRITSEPASGTIYGDQLVIISRNSSYIPKLATGSSGCTVERETNSCLTLRIEPNAYVLLYEGNA